MQSSVPAHPQTSLWCINRAGSSFPCYETPLIPIPGAVRPAAEMCERDFGSVPSPGHGRVWALTSVPVLPTVGVQSPVADSWGGLSLPLPPALGRPSESQELAGTPEPVLLHPVLMSEPLVG